MKNVLFLVLFLITGIANAGYEGGSANQVLRVPSAGGRAKFGAVDVAQSAAITGILGTTHGGTGLAVVLDQPYEITNCSITTSVSSNALTIALKDKSGSDPSSTSPCRIGFRSSTAATGTYTEVAATAATSIVVSSGSTLGCTSAAVCTLYVYAINNAGTIVLGVGNNILPDEGSVYTTTVLAGSGADDSAAVLYTTATQTTKALRLIGRVTITEATAGTWASNATEVSNLPFFYSNYLENVNPSFTNWPITAGQYGDLASLSLPAGEWDVTCVVVTLNNGAVTTTDIQIGISTTTGNSNTGLGNATTLVAIKPAPLTNGSQTSLVIPNVRVLPTSTTTYYCKGEAATSVANLQYTIRMIARRMK